VGAVPLLAGVFDLCVFAPLFGYSISGSRTRAAAWRIPVSYSTSSGCDWAPGDASVLCVIRSKYPDVWDRRWYLLKECLGA
jgi:hypothetical protein